MKKLIIVLMGLCAIGCASYKPLEEEKKLVEVNKILEQSRDREYMRDLEERNLYNFR